MIKYAVLETIDGRDIILTRPDHYDMMAEIVLAKFGDIFVTWRRNVDEPSDFYWGHYFDTLLEALEDFIERGGRANGAEY
jgi:hypothetical protein